LVLASPPLYIIYLHCRKIHNLFVPALETSLFNSEWEFILYLMTMYIYCVFLAILKGSKQLPNCLKIAETSVVQNVFKYVTLPLYISHMVVVIIVFSLLRDKDHCFLIFQKDRSEQFSGICEKRNIVFLDWEQDIPLNTNYQIPNFHENNRFFLNACKISRKLHLKAILYQYTDKPALYIYNIHTLYNLFAHALETSLFNSEWEFILYLMTMYIYSIAVASRMHPFL
jgi:hypothetical protein